MSRHGDMHGELARSDLPCFVIRSNVGVWWWVLLGLDGRPTASSSWSYGSPEEASAAAFAVKEIAPTAPVESWDAEAPR